MRKIILILFIVIVAFSFKKKDQVGIIDSGVKFSTSSLNGWFDMSNKRSFNNSISTIYWNDLKGGVIGQLINGAAFVSDNGGCVSFDRVNDYVTLFSNYNFTSQDFSFNFWINLSNTTASNGSSAPVVLYKGSYNTNGYYLEMGATGLVFYTCKAGNTQFSIASATIITNTWYNVCITRSGASVRIYINGTDATTTAGTHQNPASSSNNFLIGVYNTNYYMGGKVSQFFVYDKQLTAAEILQNYNALKARF